MDFTVFELAKAGDATSIEKIVEQYHRLAYSTAYDWIRKGAIPREEGISEANLALMKCIRGNFDCTKGEFTSYLVRAVDNQIRMYLRREKRERQIEYVDSYIDMEDGTVDVLDSIEDTGLLVEDVVERQMLVSTIMKILHEHPIVTQKEVDCLMLRMNGLTCDEIAVELDMSQSYASRLSNTAVEKVKQILEDMGEV